QHVTASTPKELAEAVRKASGPCEISVSSGDYDLLSQGDNSLVYEGGDGYELLIQGVKDAPRPPTIRFQYDASARGPDLAALTVKSGTVHLRGLRFVADARQTGITLAAVCRLGGHVLVEDCLFIQGLPSGYGGRLSSLEVRGPVSPNGQPGLTVTG